MRILILSTYAAPYRVAVFKGISKAHNVDVFFEGNNDEERNSAWFQRSDVKFPYMLINTKQGLKEYQRSKKHIKDYDLVLCYEPFSKTAMCLQLLCMLRNVPYIINADGACDISTGLMKRLIKSFFIRNSLRCFAGSHSAKKYLLYYGAKENQILMHNFTSLYADEILDKPLTRNEKLILRKKYGLPSGAIAIAVGRFIPIKGFDVLLKARNLIENDNLSLLIVGGGPEKGDYQKFINDNNLKKVFLKDYYPHEQLMELFQASDFFIMPSKGDVWGLVVNEAMACGLPVISSDRCVAGVELVANGENGFIYSVDDATTLADKIEVLSNDMHLCEAMGNNAIKTIQNYTYESVIESHLATLEECQNII